MARLRLRKLIRGEAGAALEQMLALGSGPIGVFDLGGRLLLGADPGEAAPSYGIAADDQQLGDVRGGSGAEAVAAMLRHLAARELEKVQLANETLGRYKELTLLYDMSDRLSRMLEPGDVARSVVEEACRAVNGHQAVLLMHDRRTDTLVALANHGGDGEITVLPAQSGVEGRVLRTGQAEFVEEVDTAVRGTLDRNITSLICAPLRSGERVVGVLRVTDTRPAAWNAGDLKLVTSLAAQAASALQGAELHRNRMREMALKHHLQRYVSPLLVDAVSQGPSGPPRALALLFCDLSGAEPSAAAPDSVVVRMEVRLTRAVEVLLGHGAVVDLPQGEMILAAFEGEGLGTRSVQAAFDLIAAIASDAGEGEVPGVGITVADLASDDGGHALAEALSAAAVLQGASGGRVLVDYDVRSALTDRHHLTQVSGIELPGDRTVVFEVRP